MRRVLATFAVIAAALGLALADAASAREHDGDRGGRWARGAERPQERQGPWRGERGGERGPPPGWARGPGRWERPQMAPPPEAYGPPPRYDQPRRGGYLPPQARGGVVRDYGRYRLRPPPPGYGWVRSGRSLMLMDMNSGQVFDVIPD